ncbi:MULTISPECIES: acyl carrier protein [unclassified Streptomyces]|uniref:acyl carrier protein n=1 Tax=unclassified Streptomyces TaxID=2593676 RepID=UPI0011A15896|nr:acyl carrier protein [Streptomyces sp. BK340]TVZ80488.1 act minimal PKS acyl carrier protein [Streptomyces sp. BK340]
MSEFSIDDLKRILRKAAGEDETTSLDGDILELSFQDLGYDSLARMEAVSLTEREYGISLSEEEMDAIVTPGEFLAFVNGRISAAA